MNTSTQGTVVLLDVASSATFTDSHSVQWSADTGAGWSGGTVSTGSYAVANTIDDPLYYTRRYGNMTYTKPADNGVYTLKLYFADPTMTAAGKRVFNVSAQGTQILSNFDIFAVAGAKTANIQTFTINITTGQLSLVFSNIVDNAIVSAIQLTPNQPNQPAAPTGLTATAGDSNSINLSWTDNATNESGYKIERSKDNVNWTLIAPNLPANTTSYPDTGLTPNTKYFYRVRATNGGLDSVYSNVTSGTTIVAAPGGIAASPNGASAINVTWNAVNGASTYFIERSNDGLTGWIQIAAPQTNSYPDAGLLAGTQYFYRVRAVVPAGTTSYSLVASATTSQNQPGAPTNPATSQPTGSSLALSWDATPSATGYKVERSLDGATGWQQIATPSINSYTDTGPLNPVTTYYYRVRATVGGQDSPYSVVFSGTTTSAVPASPAVVNAQANTATQITVSWSAVSGATTYRVERSPDGSTAWAQVGQLVNSTNAPSYSYADSPLNPNTPYFYRVFASNSSGDSVPSATANTTTPALPDRANRHQCQRGLFRPDQHHLECGSGHHHLSA